MSVSAADRHASVVAPPEEYLELAYNFRMTDLQAAVGLVQLGKLAEVVERRRTLAAATPRRSPTSTGCAPSRDPEHGTSNFQSYWVRGAAGLPDRP